MLTCKSTEAVGKNGEDKNCMFGKVLACLRKYLSILFAIVIASVFTGCSSIKFLDEKGYNRPSNYYPVNNFKSLLFEENVVIDKGHAEYELPFIVKADSITFVNDSSIILFEERLNFDEIRVSTKFKYFERRGIAGRPFSVSKNNISFSVYYGTTNEIVTEKILKNLIDNSTNEVTLMNSIYAVHSQGSAKVISFVEESRYMFMVNELIVLIPRPLPEGEYPTPNCGISGNGDTFIFEGFGILHSSGLFFSFDELSLYNLTAEDILKLYSE